MGGDDGQTKKLTGYSDIEDGPMSEANRQCRDILCCLMFLTMIVAMGYFSIYGYMNGNLNRPYRATDSNGVVCGEPGGVAQAYAYSYFYNPTTFDLSNRYCVKTCPYFDSTSSLTTIECYGQPSCNYAVTIDSSGSYSANPASTSVIIGYDTSSLIGRICVPSSTVFAGAFSTYVTTFSTYLSQNGLSSFITDLQNNWQWLLTAFGFAIVLSFIFMYTLRCFAGLIVWVSAIGIIVVLALGGFIFLYNAGIIVTPDSTSGYLSIPTVNSGSETTNKILGYALFGMSGFFLLMLLCCCSRIRIAVAVCKTAGLFVANTCGIVLVPIIQTAIVMGLWGICLYAMLYLVSAATFTHTSGDVFTAIGNLQDQALIEFYIFLFGTLWCNAFIQAVGVFVIASACCIWYYSHGPNQDETNFPIFRSYKMVFRYHFGSLAFGSLILAIVQFLQIVVEAFKKQAEASGTSNKCLEYVTNCVTCCLQCVQRIVQFINKTAYIQIALRGKSFCNAAADGFQIVWSNPIRYLVVNGVGWIIMFLGKLMIASSTTVCFYLLITYVSSIKQNIIEPIYLLIIVFIMAFAVGMLFMSVYSIAMDTIMQCFIVDEANQQSKGGKTAKYAPEQIQSLLDMDEE